MCTRLLALILLFTFVFTITVRAESSFQKGMCYASWDKERYLSAYSDKSLEALARIGVEWVAIVTTSYQQNYNSKEIFTTGKTPSEASIIHAIRKAHALGLKVMLKPHLDLLNQSGGLWRADIGFQNETDWKEWFAQYLKFILHYARIAEEERVELFCIGTELCFASQQTSFWQQYIIPKIREVYSGKLIYAANWDEYKKVSFWQELDFIGLDGYFPLVEKKNPDFEELKAVWVKWADEIEGWQKGINKQIIFTEIGYRSCQISAAKPWDSSFSREADLSLQSDCYKAALDALYNRSWCGGIYWWYWEASIYAGGMNNRDFTPQNKPAEIIISYWYKGLVNMGQLSP